MATERSRRTPHTPRRGQVSSGGRRREACPQRGTPEAGTGWISCTQGKSDSEGKGKEGTGIRILTLLKASWGPWASYFPSPAPFPYLNCGVRGNIPEASPILSRMPALTAGVPRGMVGKRDCGQPRGSRAQAGVGDLLFPKGLQFLCDMGCHWPHPPRALCGGLPTCFLALPASHRILRASRCSSDTSSLVCLRWSPCRPAASCSSWIRFPRDRKLVMRRLPAPHPREGKGPEETPPPSERARGGGSGAEGLELGPGRPSRGLAVVLLRKSACFSKQGPWPGLASLLLTRPAVCPGPHQGKKQLAFSKPLLKVRRARSCSTHLASLKGQVLLRYWGDSREEGR